MKIYLASSAPGNESKRKEGMLPIKQRLLSYYHIKIKTLENHLIFKVIQNENRKK
jgi:hypothetical protein